MNPVSEKPAVFLYPEEDQQLIWTVFASDGSAFFPLTRIDQRVHANFPDSFASAQNPNCVSKPTAFSGTKFPSKGNGNISGSIENPLSQDFLESRPVRTKFASSTRHQTIPTLRLRKMSSAVFAE